MPDESGPLKEDDLRAEVQALHARLRETHRQLESLQARHNGFVESAPLGVATLDAAGYITEVNGAGAALLGTTRERLMFRHIATALGLESRRAFQDHLDAATRQRAVAEIAVTRKSDSAQITLQVCSERSAAGGFLTTFTDVTHVKDLEERLRQFARAGDMLSVPLDRASVLATITRIAVPAMADVCMIDLADETGTLQRATVTFSDPRKEAELATRLLRGNGERPGWKTPQTKVVESGAPALIELRGATLEGADILRDAGLETMIISALTSRDRALGTLTLVSKQRYAPADLQCAKDLGRRAAMALDNVLLDEKAKRAAAERDNLLAMVSRELRNPLSVIMMKLAQVAKHAPQPERRDSRALEAISVAAKELEVMASDLSDIDAIDAGRLNLDRQKHSLRALVEEAIAQVRPIAAEQQQWLDIAVPDPGPNVQADRGRLLQVLTNVLEYSIAHCPDGATISLRTEVSGPFVRIAVADTGTGLEPEELAHVFDRFWPTRRKARHGSGLGLSIVKGLVEAHGGRIWAESRPGDGTRIFFTVPLASASQRTVMVVDDDAEMRDILAEALRHEGYHVSSARNGADALATLKRLPTSVVLLDLHMPVLDGWDFLAEREKEPKLKGISVVVISGSSEDKERLAKYGAAWVPKPIHIDELLKTLERV